MSRVALLDVNILVALFDPNHTHHELSHDWFDDHRALGWATCPITEIGFVRVVASLMKSEPGTRPPDLVDRLQVFCRSGNHEFWPDAVSIGDAKVFDVSRIRGHRQMTDIYLLGLARKMGGCLATFDQTIPLGAVRGATRDTLQIIQPGI